MHVHCHKLSIEGMLELHISCYDAGACWASCRPACHGLPVTVTISVMLSGKEHMALSKLQGRPYNLKTKAFSGECLVETSSHNCNLLYCHRQLAN